jgi:hypothetical protein
MLVTFTTDTYADITMFGDVALTMLKMMGTVRCTRRYSGRRCSYGADTSLSTFIPKRR